MIGRYLSIVAVLGAIVLPSGGLRGQPIRGPTEHTTCSSPVRPNSGWTYHGGYRWAVTWYTFPFQMGFAQYSASPNPAISDDGRATWYNPGAYVECTNTWYYNLDGSVAYVEFRWHVISYSGEIRENSDSGCGGDGGGDWGGTDPIYITSYDPYAPEQEGDVSVQDCGGGGGGGGGGTLVCWWEWMEIEISYDGGKTWHPFWSGWGQVCEHQAA